MTVRRYLAAIEPICRRRLSDITADVGFCIRGTQYSTLARPDRQAASSASGRSPSASIATPRSRTWVCSASRFIPE